MSIVAKLIVLNAGANAVKKLNGANWASPVVGLVNNVEQQRERADDDERHVGCECILDGAEMLVPLDLFGDDINP